MTWPLSTFAQALGVDRREFLVLTGFGHVMSCLINLMTWISNFKQEIKSNQHWALTPGPGVTRGLSRGQLGARPGTGIDRKWPVWSLA